MADRLDPTLADPARYRHWTPVTLRFRDLDLLGHVNNVAIAGWLEDGRVGLELPIQPLSADWRGPVVVLASLRIEFLGEVHFGDDVRIGTRVQRLGTSSFTIGQAVFAGERCTAVAEAVEVVIDPASRAPIPLPPDFRALFDAHR